MNKNLINATWGINPFIKSRHATTQIKNFIKPFAEKLHIAPVFVVNPGEFNIFIEDKGWDPFLFKIAGTKHVEKKFKDLPKEVFDKPQVIYEENPKVTVAAKTLCKHAADHNSELILCNTRADRMGSFGIGSFAQALLLNSDIPVLTFNPKTKSFKNLDNLLFVTDFSVESREVFYEFCKFAKKLNAKVTVMHHIAEYADWFTDPMMAANAGVSIFDPEAYLSDARKWANDDAKKFLRIAEKAEVVAKFVLLETKERAADAIAKYAAKNKFGIVGMAAVAGNVLGNLLGTTSQKVVAQSLVPVWVARVSNHKLNRSTQKVRLEDLPDKVSIVAS